jgi:hypothetical protein
VFACVQIPIADLRQFVVGPTGRLSAPPWPLPDPGRHFIRAFGAVRERPRGGVDEWFGEDFHCNASGALKFPYNEAPFKGSEGGIILRPIYRRYFAGGHPRWAGAIARVDLGFNPYWPRQTIQGRADYLQPDPIDVARSCLTLTMTVPGITSKPREVAVIGNAVAKKLLNATTSQKLAPALVSSWWVTAGTPLVLVEAYGHSDKIAKILNASEKPEETAEPVAAHEALEIEYRGRRIPVWVVYYDNSIDMPTFRRLRIHLWRLHNEREVLRLTLAAIIEDKIDPGTSPALKDYLARQSDRLHRHYVDGFVQRDILQYAYSLDRLVSADHISKLQRIIESVSPGVASAVFPLANGSDKEPSISEGQSITVVYAGDGNIINTQKGQIAMGENPQNILNTGNAGIISGRDTVASNAVGKGDQTVTQTWTQFAETVDIKQLSAELESLRAELRSQAGSDPDHDIAIAEIAQAEKAAAEGDKSSLRDHLARAGKWCLGVAKQIGMLVAAAAIAAAMGI